MANLDIEKLVDAVSSIDGKDVTIYAGSRKVKVDEEFALVFYNTLFKLMKVLNKNDLIVLLGLLTVTQYGNCISINQSAIAKEIGVRADAMSRSMKNLIKLGCVLKTDLGIFINPSLITKGKLDKIDPALWRESFKFHSEIPIPITTEKSKRQLYGNVEESYDEDAHE